MNIAVIMYVFPSYDLEKIARLPLNVFNYLYVLAEEILEKVEHRNAV